MCKLHVSIVAAGAVALIGKNRQQGGSKVPERTTKMFAITGLTFKIELCLRWIYYILNSIIFKSLERSVDDEAEGFFVPLFT